MTRVISQNFLLTEHGVCWVEGGVERAVGSQGRAPQKVEMRNLWKWKPKDESRPLTAHLIVLISDHLPTALIRF